MSTLPPSSSPDDPLSRAEAAFQRIPVPEGPSEAIVARTLAALAAKAESDSNPLPRRRAMFVTMKIAAAALMAAGGLFYLAVVPSTEAVAFAEVAQKLRDAHTLVYHTIAESPDLKSPMKMRSFFKEPNLLRSELEGGIITIINGREGKQLILDPARKTALLMEGKPPEAPLGPAADGGLVERLRRLTEGDVEPLGDKAIGDLQTRGFLVKNKKLGTEMTVWFDPGTRLPVRIDFSSRVQGMEIRVTTSDFQIDPDVDDALFRVAPPPGYTLRKVESNLLEMNEKTLLNPEKAAVALLRLFAEKNGGAFPKRLDDLTEFNGKETHKRGELPDAKTLQVVHALSRFMMATRTLKGGFGYRSEGVKLGDADKILFWYRPEGTVNYRAIYGDLHASDVAEDRLPEKAKP